MKCRSIFILTRNIIARNGGITPERIAEMQARFEDAELFIDWLSDNVQITPHIKTKGGVAMILERLMDPKNNVPEVLANKAFDLYEKYKAEAWGENSVPDEEDDHSGTTAAAATATATTTSTGLAASTVVVDAPPDTDPIFGLNGIMYGIVICRNGKRNDYRLRPDIPRRSFKSYGHNNIPLGAWYPLQISALFWGAHGARMAGISGNTQTGAWSIVVSGTYHDLDSDQGSTLYYSGSNSHDNTDPQRAAMASNGTKALHASLATQNPVRVLRSGNASGGDRNRHLPPCGLRYDGLYRVTEHHCRTNAKGGLYDQFILVRLPGQTALAELERSSPTLQQKFAFANLRAGN